MCRGRFLVSKYGLGKATKFLQWGRICVPQGRKSLRASLELHVEEKVAFLEEVIPRARGESSP
jgi:hypothetical protein